MSDFGLFESDEAAQAEPRLAAKTAGRKLEAAIDNVRSQFGKFLIAATGIDEFEDRWHLSKNDIRASVEPLVFPNTGTMRRIKNALKADWKLAHPYKVGLSHDEAGFGSMPEGDHDHRNQNLKKTYHPSDGNLIPKGDFEGWKDSVDQGGPEKVEAHDFTPGGDSGSAKKARRVEARDPRHYDMVGHEYDNINYPEGSPEIMEDDGDHEGLHNYYRNLMEEPPAGYPRRERSYFEDEKPPVKPAYTGPGDLGSFIEDRDPILARRKTARSPKCNCDAYDHPSHIEGEYVHSESCPRYDMYEDENDDDSGKKEAARLVADIYTDFAQANGLRVASLDTLDAYAENGIHEADYRLLQSMIIRAAEEEAEKEAAEDSEDDEDDDSDSEGGDDDFGGESGSESDSDNGDDGDDDDSGEDDEDDDSGDDDEEYDFGGGDDSGQDGGGQQYTVPEQAPDLDPQLLNEIPHDDTDGSAPVPPEVIDSLLGLPEGTIEQLLLQEVEQGQGGAPQGDPGQGGSDFGGAPEAGGDDFLGDAGGDNTQPPRMARRRKAIQLGPPLRGEEGARAKALMDRDKENLESIRNGKNPYLHPGYNYDEERWYTPDELRQREAARRFWAAPDESEEELTERQKKQQRESIDTQHESWAKSKSARRFWAADDNESGESDSSGGGDSGGGDQAPAQDPAAAGMDPSMMGGGQPMLPPPGSQAVQPPAPPMPIENQPAEDALLDTANQAIMQMIDRETQEYQQIIGPLSQALQAVQFAQQVEQSEHPMDVTPPEGTVNVDPSQAPGGAQNPQQQLASMVREVKTVRTLKNAAKLIGKTFGVNSNMLIEAMSRRNYEHVAEAFRILPSAALQSPEVRAAVSHIGKMFETENSMFNHEAWMDSVVGQRVAGTARDRYENKAYTESRDKGRAEHARQDVNQLSWFGRGVEEEPLPPGANRETHPHKFGPENPDHAYYHASRSRLPFDGPRLAGETLKNTPTMDRFEFPNEQPEITDNMTINDLPKHQFKGLPKMKATLRQLAWGTSPKVAPKVPKMPSEKSGDDVMGKYQRYTTERAEKGLNFGDNDVTVENFLRDRNIGSEAAGKLHESLGISHPPVPKATAPKAAVPKAKNPTLKRGTWGEWEPTKQASFFTRRVPDWRWDDHLNGYISKEGKAFTCSCGQKVAAPSYKSCDCGKIWNVYAIGDTHHLASDSAEMFIAREIPVRDNVIMANKKMAGKAETSHQELLAMIDKLADWTKYDTPDPINEMGKKKPASTEVAPPPKDWATRLPKGDPSKKGGTWTRPTIPRKKK